MARITIDTGINTAPVLRGAAEITRAIQSLKGAVGRVGRDLDASVVGYARAMQNNATVTRNFNEQISTLEAAASRLRSQLIGMAATRVRAPDFERVTNEIKAAEKALQGYEREERSLASQGADVLETRWDRLADTITRNQKNIAAFGTPEYQDYVQAIAERNRMIASGEEELVMRYKENTQQIAETMKLRADLVHQRDDMRARGQDTQSGIETEQYKTAAEELKNIEQELQQVRRIGAEALKPQHIKEWEQMETITGRMEENYARFQNTANMAGYAITHPIEALNRAIPLVSAEFENLIGRIANVAVSMGRMAVDAATSTLRRMASAAVNAAAGLARMAASSVVSFIQRLADSARNAAVNLARMAGAGIVNGLKKMGSLALKAGSALLGIGKSARRSNGGLKQSLTMIIRYTLGIRSLFMLVRRLRSAVVDAFKNMAQKVPEVNKTISSLASSLDQVKNSLATAFQPILTAVAPYLVQLMDMLAGAMTRVGEFFAALTGQNYVYKATKAQIDYAKSLDKTKKKAKETENQLAGFDHLNILKDTKNDSSNTDNKTPTSDFQKMPIESWIKDLADRIKALFKQGDFFGIGKLLADKLEELINKIDFKKLGQKIAEGLNIIAEIVNGFFDGDIFAKLGGKLAEAFNSLVDAGHWKDIGALFTAKIRALIDFVWGFVMGLKGRFDKIGLALGDFLQGAFDNIPFERLAETLGVGITGIFMVIYKAASRFDWPGAGERLSNSFKILVDNIDIDTIYDAMSTTIKGILDLITPTLTDTETWGKIASDFAQFMNRLFQDDELWDKLRLALIGGVSTAIASLKIFVSKFEWGKNGQKFHDQLFKLVDEFPFNELGSALSELLNGSLKFMNEVFGDDTLFYEIGNNLSTFLNRIFNNKEFWTESGTLAGNMMKDILAFGNGALDGFKPDAATKNIKAALGKIPWGEIASSTWELAKKFFKKAGNFLDVLFSDDSELHWDPWEKMYVANPATSLGSKIGKKLADAINAGVAALPAGEIGKALDAALNGVLDFAITLVQNFDADEFRTKFEEALDEVDWDSIVRKIWLALKDGLIALAKSTPFLGEVINGFEADISADEVASTLKVSLGQAMEDVAAYGNVQGGLLGDNFYDGFRNLILDENNHVKEEFLGRLSEIFSPSEIAALESGDLTVSQFYNGMAFGGIDAEGQATESLLSIVNGMLNAPSADAEVAGTDIANNYLSSYILQALQRQPDAENAVDGAFKEMWEALDAGGYGDILAFDYFNSFIGTVMDESYHVKPEFQDVVKSMFGSVETLENGEVDAQDFLRGLVQGMWDSSGETSVKLVDIIDNILNDVKTDPDALDENSPSKRAETYGADFMIGLQNGVNNESANTQATMSTAMDGVVNTVESKWGDASDAQSTKLNEMSNALSTTMGDMTNTSTEGTENQAKPVYDKYGEIMLAVEECMRSAWDYMKQYTGNMVSTMQTDMNRVQGNANTGMNGLERSISDSFNRIGNMNWAYIGQNICNGIQQGIYNGWGWLNNTVWNLANSLFQSAKNALGIASPSKVFRDQVGYMVGAGLAEGLDDSQHEVLGSITDMAKAMVDEMQTTDLTADVGVNDDTLLSSISGALSTFSIKIEDSFITLTERLQAIADKVTFITPDIAAGTVLPYAIQGDVNVNTDNVAVALEKNNEELINIMIQLVNNQTSAIVSGLERYCTTNVNIDKKGLTDAIIEEINRRTRAAGSSPLLI